jgi:hypothetical protein
VWQCPIIRGVEGNAYTQYTFHVTQPSSIDFLPATAGYSGKAHCRKSTTVRTNTISLYSKSINRDRA